MAKQCGSKACNRTGLWMCRGCRGWFCIHYVHSAMDCNATAFPEEMRGSAVCYPCSFEGVK